MLPRAEGFASGWCECGLNRQSHAASGTLLLHNVVIKATTVFPQPGTIASFEGMDRSSSTSSTSSLALKTKTTLIIEHGLPPGNAFLQVSHPKCCSELLMPSKRVPSESSKGILISPYFMLSRSSSGVFAKLFWSMDFSDIILVWEIG